MRIVPTISIVFLASSSFGSVHCTQLKQELKAMQNAQKQIMLSLVNNHETFASSLEEYSDVVSLATGASTKAVSANMNQSAQAFRSRGLEGKKMLSKLNSASEDLIARVSSCLR